MEIKPKRPKLSSPSDGNQLTLISTDITVINCTSENDQLKEKLQSLLGSKKVEEQPLPGSTKVDQPLPVSREAESKTKMDSSGTGLLGLAYASSDDEE